MSATSKTGTITSNVIIVVLFSAVLFGAGYLVGIGQLRWVRGQSFGIHVVLAVPMCLLFASLAQELSNRMMDRLNRGNPQDAAGSDKQPVHRRWIAKLIIMACYYFSACTGLYSGFLPYFA